MQDTKAGSPYEGEPQESTAPDATAASGKNPGVVTISQGTLTSFQRDVLRAIAASHPHHDPDADHPHGLRIRETLELWYGTQVNHGRLYPNLDTLVEHGLVAKTDLDGRTNTYQLTKEGRYWLRQHAQRWVNAAEALHASNESGADQDQREGQGDDDA